MRRSDALPVCRGQRIPDVRDAVTSDDADQASAAALTASFTARATKMLIALRRAERKPPMVGPAPPWWRFALTPSASVWPSNLNELDHANGSQAECNDRACGWLFLVAIV